MAKSFAPLKKKTMRRLVIVGPSHFVDFDGCALTTATHMDTPLGRVAVDTQANAELMSTGKFHAFAMAHDEAEHSAEMFLPMLQQLLGDEVMSQLQVLVVYVSKTTAASQAEYAKLLEPYCTPDDSFVLLSSDFCHWGKRFDYTHLPANVAPGTQRSDQIEQLDREGCAAIGSGDAQVFREYMNATQNTICGQAPILMFMEMSKLKGWSSKFDFNGYDQSHTVVTEDDSSVSYVSCHISKGAANKSEL
jgi:AmmeMemoRadiSam system protein B